MQSDLRRPERWRGRVRGPFAEWSVFVGAGVAILLGIVFWTSVWIVLRPSSTTVLSSDRLEATGRSADELDETSTADADTLEDAEAPVWQVAENSDAVDEDADAPAWRDSISPDADAEAVAEGPSAQGQVYGPTEPLYGPIDPDAGPAEVAYAPMAPAYGPPDPIYGPVEEPAASPAVASTNPDKERVAARTDEMTARTDEINARAGEITVKAEELVAKAEEFVVKIEGLNARIEELEAKLEASSTALAARPAAVPSPTPVVAQARQSQTSTVRNSLALSAAGRAPWVVSPLPEPGSRVTAGPLVLEARARGEAPITQISMQIDSAPVQVALDQRDEKTWRGRASVRVTPGAHTVAITVVDSKGRTGSYRWQFNAAGP